MKNLFSKTAFFALVIVVLAAGWTWYLRSDNSSVLFRTAAVTRGELVATIGATGTVEPEELVDVGAQVAGQILAFGKDKDGNEVDYGSFVEEGTVLAQIDDTVYKADVALTKAQWENAKAGVHRAEADLEQMKAKLDQAQRDWERAQKLGPSEALRRPVMMPTRACIEAARANVSVGEAVIEQAKASVEQTAATLQKAQRNLTYCTIKAPVNGVVIDRRVNIGQTVVASLNAPSLFLIAKDLRRMQVWVAVNEADIGNIYVGQPVTFTVDAYPGQTFKGEVGKIRLNATMTQNVVTYTVEVITDNSDNKLLPYLTANVEFQLARRENILTVPNLALKWLPQAKQVVEEFRASVENDGQEGGSEGQQKPNDPNAHHRGARSVVKEGMLWVQDGSLVRPLKVSVGMTDGTMTEVSGTEVNDGMQVVIGEQQQAQAGDGTTNPFTPKFPQRGGRPGGR